MDKLISYRNLGFFIDDLLQVDLINETEVFSDDHGYCLVLFGKGDYRINTSGLQTRILGPGDLLLLYKGSEVEIERKGASEDFVTVFTFSGSSCHSYLAYLGLEDGRIIHTRGKKLEDDIGNIALFYQNEDYVRASLRLQELLLDASKQKGIRDLDDEIVMIHDYMIDHMDLPLDLTLLADMYGSSISYFSRAFKAHYEKAPMIYLTDCRMARACRLLETSHLLIADVALRCGYEKLEYFCYVFKKRYHCTPTQYRIERQKQTKTRKV